MAYILVSWVTVAMATIMRSVIAYVYFIGSELSDGRAFVHVTFVHKTQANLGVFLRQTLSLFAFLAFLPRLLLLRSTALTTQHSSHEIEHKHLHPPRYL